MLATLKGILLLLAFLANFSLGLATTECMKIMTVYYQTEDQYYELGCDREVTSQSLLYRCRFLQKKMDIFGRKYYDFGVSYLVSLVSSIRAMFYL